jgi:hypothetical protein
MAEMTYQTLAWRNRLFGLFPRVAKAIERARLAFGYLPRLEQGVAFLPMPYQIKRGMIARMAMRSGARVLVETGTYLGDTPWQLRGLFDRIWTVEVHPPLAKLARDRFASIENVTVVEGDSRRALKDIVSQVNAPLLYWLDGHYSGGITGMGDSVCPIFEELEVVFNRTKTPFVVMIDDARLFGSEAGYPTLYELRAWLDRQAQPSVSWLENDVIFVIPRSHPLVAECQNGPFEPVLSLMY